MARCGLRRCAALAVLVFALAGAGPGPAPAPAPVRLIAHQALYRLTLEDGRGQVIGAEGMMGYEVVDACQGWRVHQRLQLATTSTTGETSRLVSDYTTWEAKNGTRLRFHVVQTDDGAVRSELTGTARLDRPGGPGVVDYTTPRREVALPAGTVFPMAHTAAVIAAAEAGQRFFTLMLFDGTGAHGAGLTSIVGLDRRDPRPEPWPALAELPSVRVHIAFFGHDPRRILPEYETGMRYWTNGVAGALRMDFGDFVVVGKLVAFQQLPDRCGGK